MRKHIGFGAHSRRLGMDRVGMPLAVLAAMLCASPIEAQSASLIGGVAVQHMQQERKELAAAERQKKMESDAERLVTLAQQLKVSVDKTNKDVLSIDVIRDAERIEKLAREVRESMRQ